MTWIGWWLAVVFGIFVLILNIAPIVLIKEGMDFADKGEIGVGIMLGLLVYSLEIVIALEAMG